MLILAAAKVEKLLNICLAFIEIQKTLHKTLGVFMKASDLVTVWSAADNSRLTAKQFSFRLPVHVAAKLAALEAMYPTKSRTQLVGDLLSTAIADVEKHFPLYRVGLWAATQIWSNKFSRSSGHLQSIKTWQETITVNSKKSWAMKIQPSCRFTNRTA